MKKSARAWFRNQSVFSGWKSEFGGYTSYIAHDEDEEVSDVTQCQFVFILAICCYNLCRSSRTSADYLFCWHCVFFSSSQCILKITPSLWYTETKTPSSSSSISIITAPATFLPRIPQLSMTSLLTTMNDENIGCLTGWLIECELWKQSALATFQINLSSVYTDMSLGFKRHIHFWMCKYFNPNNKNSVTFDAQNEM